MPEEPASSDSSVAPAGLLFIVHEYPPIVGGAGQLVYDVVSEISKDEPVVVLTASESDQSRTDRSGSVEIVRLAIPFRNKQYHYATVKSLLVFTLLAIWHGWRLGRRHRFRVIHAYYLFPAGFVAVVLGKLLGIPCIVTAVGAEVFDPSKNTRLYSRWYYRRFMGAIMKRATALSAISGDIANRARSFHAGKDIKVLPPGIPTPRRLPEAQEHEGFVLCSLSRLAPRKGLELVIAALEKLRDLPIRYVIMGDGKARQDLMELGRSLGVLDRMEFRGFVTEEQKWAALSSSDIFVLPSLHEGFGISYLEAMAAGLPIIAHSVGGQTDFITDGENGFLLRDRTREELVDAILRLHCDPELRRTMGEKNRVRVKGYFTSRLKTVYLEHYREAIARHRTSV